MFPPWYLKPLLSLFLLTMRLGVLKGKPTRPFVRARLPTDPAITARKQDAPQRNQREETAT